MYEYYSPIIGYSFPLGSANSIPGLQLTTLDLFRYSNKHFPDSENILFELENLGGSLNLDVKYEFSYVTLRIPFIKRFEGEEFLKKLLDGMQTTKESIAKSKHNTINLISEIKSDPQSYAQEEFFRFITGYENETGSVKSIEGLVLTDFQNQISFLKENATFFDVSDPNSIPFTIIQKDYKLNKLKKRALVKSEYKECGQVYFYLGFQTEGIDALDLATSLVADVLIGSSEIGMLHKRVREKNSLAYWTVAQQISSKSFGVNFLHTICTQGDFLKVIDEISTILKDIKEVNISKKNFDLAKIIAEGRVRAIKDIPESALRFYLRNINCSKRYANLTLDGFIKEIQGVTKADLIKFYEKVYSNSNLCKIYLYGETKGCDINYIKDKLGES